METLRTMLSVIYDDHDISSDVTADLLSCSCTDAIDDEADELSLTLMDPDGKWAGQWSPERGATVSVTVSTESRGSLSTGRMAVDALKASGSPRIFEMRAVSIPLAGSIRRTVKNRNFEKLDLRGIASQIASEAGLELLWDSQINPQYDRIDQRRESDLAFLKRLCDDEGLTVKASDGQLVIFDQASYEKKTPVKTLYLGMSPVLSWSFEARQSERYKAVTVRWRDIRKKTRSASPAAKARTARASDDESINMYGSNYTDMAGASKKGATVQKAEYVEATFTDDTVGESGQIYVMKKRCSSYAEAERLAKAKLRELNLRQISGSLSLIGDPELIAGQVIRLTGFGAMDGNFIIERSTHIMSEQGYRTSLEIRKANTVY